MPSQLDELLASMRELEAQLSGAPAEFRPILVQQLESMRAAADMLRSAQPAIDANKLHRATLTPELEAFFRPEPPVVVPTSIPDGTRREQIHEAAMRCPPEARVYSNEAWIGCAIPGVPGVSLSISHGLQLGFRSDGSLASQTLYDRGLVRWAIQYHTTGARESAGFYASTEPLSYPPHGLHTRWAPNGRIVAQAMFVAGRQHGWQKLWEDDGYPIGATRFADGHVAEHVYPDPARALS